MTSLTPSTFHPLYLNPLLSLDVSLAPFSRDALAAASAATADDDAADPDLAAGPFERDEAGESVLQALLLSLLGPGSAAVEDDGDAPMPAADVEPEVLDFHLFASKPVERVRLVPLVVEHQVPNPNHASPSKRALKALKQRALDSAVSGPSILSASLLAAPARSTRTTGKPAVPYSLVSPASTPGLPALACTVRERSTAGPRMRAYGLPPPGPPERGPGGHLPCAQLPVSLSSLPSPPAPTAVGAAASDGAKRKRKRPLAKHHRSRPSAPARTLPTFFYPPPSPSTTLPSALGCAYGRPAPAYDGSFERDRNARGWVDSRKGESWWGARKDVGGPGAKETAKARRKAFWA